MRNVIYMIQFYDIFYTKEKIRREDRKVYDKIGM